jgi:tetratricopeptide (TPR) repeat protein
MRVQIALLAAAGVATFTAGVQAQTIVTHGVGLAHDCYIYAKVGNDPRAGVEVCNEALKREMLTTKDQAATHDNRGVILDVVGRVDEAADDFNAAIRLDPGLGDPYVNLGSMLIKKRQYEAALAHINKGIDLGVSFPHVGYYDRAVAEQLMGRYKEAYYDYKKVLELEPNYKAATERLKDFTVTTVPKKTPN